ncbi:hypothetical protein CR205_00445 [Alteribacter lacisalsi]|uniref:Formate dehydrogenase accessory protein FdhE n=1 Tax=Alteribacter lacisalsi TaxID=2045244 RepID=A0A2W0H848_9BACI|nr:formate dehydrogenase accessory protein FdhE [Alteribacter lacisalsi]PYZ97111.1 hypothetical protein CR205_00445 [Alteribacter lacisalsi]
MEKSMISDDYLRLQKRLTGVQEKIRKQADRLWQEQIDEEQIDREFPVLRQLEKPPVTVGAFAEAALLISMSMKENMPALDEDLNRCMNLLEDEKTAYTWMKHALMYNTGYFQDVSDEHKIAAWLPHFLAEHALRPFLKAVGEHTKGLISSINAGGVCPCCGEPVRIRKVWDGMNRFQCPRCETDWEPKGAGCAHCGEKKEGLIIRLTVKEEPGSELEVCGSCKQYVKIVTDLSAEEPAAILDLLTIHLDYIAQEEGFDTGDQRR